MIFTSLYAKLSAVLLFIFLAVGTILVLVSVYSTDMYQQEVNQKLNHEIARLIVAEKLVMKNNRINEDALKDIFHMLMVINPSIEVYLLDPEGNILSYSADPAKIERTRVDLKPVKKFLDGSATYPILGEDPRGSDTRKAFSVARIPRTGELEGYIYVILGGEAYDSIVEKLNRSYVLRLTVWSIIASLAVAGASALILFATLTRRLRSLASAVDAYKDGAAYTALNLPVSRANRGDEIDRLISAFRQMAEQIQQQVESLKNNDLLRRELVASVSHDLRTPLATLQGYIETLRMKDGTLSEEERLDYLDVAIKHCNRLGKLVSDLFELAKLEAGETNMKREPFSLGELVQDVVQKFQLTADEKKVGILTDLGKELPFVYADIAMIERVLENLLDNALRFSPKGGSVNIVLNRAGSGITVEISDTGPGISEDEISRIFDRLYQIDNEGKRKPGNSGLGLAITRRILEMHDTSIEVRSELKAGTTFMFSLPVCNADDYSG